MNERERILQKIQKLLALADDGSNIHESARAATQAEKMMRKYQIDHAELLVDRLSKDDIETRGFQASSRNLPAWVSALAVGVARANECEVTRSGPKVIFYGTPEDVPVAYELMTYLVREVDRLTKKFDGDRGAKGSFRRGCANALYSRLEAIAVERRREFQESTAGTALVLHKKELIEQHFGRAFKYSKGRQRSEDAEGYRAGKRAGASVNLNKQLGEAAQSGRLG